MADYSIHKYVTNFFLVCAFVGACVTFSFPYVGTMMIFLAMFLVVVVSYGDGEMIHGKVLRNIPITVGAGAALAYYLLCSKFQHYIFNEEMPANWNLYHNILASLFLLYVVLVAVMVSSTVSPRFVIALACVTAAWIVVFVVFQYCMGTLFKTCG